MDPAQRLHQKRNESALDDDGERELWNGNYSILAMIGTWVSVAAVSILLPICIAMVPGPALPVVWWLVFFVVLGSWLWAVGSALYRKYSDHYWLTSQRLKHRNGILFRQSNRLELIDIDDVSFRQGPIQAVMGLGTIEIHSSDSSHPQLIMPGIADVQKVADLIDDARRDERRKRGLHIESI